MADSPERPGLLSRLARALRPAPEPTPSSSTALTKAEPAASPANVKAAPVSVSYMPMRTIGSFQPDFIPLDARGNVIDVIGTTGLAFVAYWYVATRWRAQKIAEAPLMVVEEDQETGTEEWLADHPLAPVLEEPSLDYDMGDLIERTSRYLDNGGACLWVMDRDNVGDVARLTPFARGEFEILPRPGRLYGAFRVTTAAGPKDYEADECVYFRDTDDSLKWLEDGRSRLDVAMTWLRLGEHAKQTIRDLLGNAVWPSLVVTTDPTWNPDQEQLDMLKAELNEYAAPGNKGKAFAALGGGSATVLAARIRELVPEEILNRVESVVAAISGVPAIVLQFQIGMENSPWSQMEQARRMAYDDAIVPTWRMLERRITRQLLRIEDEDKTHFIRFDRSKIASLQVDQLEAATIASMWGRAASLNERREKMGLEPVSAEDDPDGAADEIPELVQPDPLALMAGQGGADDEEGDDDEEEPAPDPDAAEKRRREFELFLKSSSLNERRFRLGLPLIDDARADEVSELAATPAGITAPAAKAADAVDVDDQGNRPKSRELPAAPADAATPERALLWLKSTSLNERRRYLGLPLINDAKADEISDLEAPAPAPIIIAPPAAPADVKGPAPTEPVKGRVTEDEEKARRRQRRRRQKVGVLQIAIRNEGVGGFALMADQLLAADQSEITAIVKRNLAEPPREDQKYLQKADRGKSRTISAILGYLKSTSQPAWAKNMRPLVTVAAERGTAVIAADIGVSFNLLNPHVQKFAREETAFLVKNVSDTTIADLQRILGDGIDAGKSVDAIARDIADSGTFARSRSRLIARTESTRANSGGPTRALEEHAKATNRRYTKTWSTAGDERVRDEHDAMEGETVGISEKFSNGREYPDEPNCRCALIYNEEVSE